MNIILKLIAGILVLHTACTQTAENSKENSLTKEPVTIQLASDIDPYCKMKVDKHFTDTTMYNGGIYSFCSIVCKEGFNKNPEKYVVK